MRLERATPMQLIKIAVRALDNPVTINSAKLTAPTLYQMVQKSICPCFCKVKPASVTYLWVEEDLLYLGMCQAFWFDRYCSCCRAVFGGRHSISQVKSKQEGWYSCVRWI